MALTEIPIELSSTPSIVDGGNATAITIDSSENVIIGGTTAGDAAADNLTLVDSGNAGMTIQAGDTSYASLYFKDSASPNSGYIQYKQGDDFMRFATNGTERMRIDAGGSVLIGKTTPADLHDTWNHIIIGEKGAIISSKGGGGIDGITLAENAYIDSDTGTYAYQTTAAASIIRQTAGITQFANAASGSAGAALTPVERMRIDSAGNLLVGTTSTAIDTSSNASGLNYKPGNFLCVSTTVGGNSNVILNKTNSQAGTVVDIRYNGSVVGTISNTSSATAYNTSSDYRLKENVVAITGATERLKQLNPSRFNFIADADTTVDGFLAHEVQDVVPEAITGTKDAMRDEEYEVTPAVLDDDGNVTTEAVMGTRSVPDYQGIDQSKLVPLLVATIQELEARLTALENN